MAKKEKKPSAGSTQGLSIEVFPNENKYIKKFEYKDTNTNELMSTKNISCREYGELSYPSILIIVLYTSY